MIQDFDIAAYKLKLDKYLSALRLQFSVELNPHPISWRMTDGTKVTTGKQYCIDVTITSSGVSQKGAEIIIQRNEDEFDNSDYYVWRDAYQIQDEYFRDNKILRGDPIQGSPYWKLWDHLEN